MSVKRVIKQYSKMALQELYLPEVYKKYAKEPVEEGKIIFAGSHHEGLDENMKPVADRLIAYGYDIIIMCRDYGRMSVKEKKEHVKSFMKEYATAEYVFLSNYFLPVASCRKRKETKVIQLWHSGGLLKKMGYDCEEDIPDYYNKSPMTNVDIFSVSSKSVAPYISNALKLPKSIFRPLGMARTDSYFDEENNKKLREKFFRLYPEAEGKKVCIYVPSFSGNAGNPRCRALHSGIDRVFAKLSDEWFFVVSLHPLLQEKYPEYKCRMSSHEMLPAADLMITDYSSIVYDHMLYKKPYIFFVPDYKHFEEERGLYLSPYELGGKVTKSLNELYNIIKNGEYEISEEVIRENIENYMTMCDGRSVDRILYSAGIDPKISLIAIDLDDTFLNDKGLMTQYGEEALKAAMDAGIEVVIASGRSYDSLPKEVTDIDGIRYAICSNGANVVDNVTGERIHSYFMTKQSVIEVLWVADKYGLFTDAFLDGIPHSSVDYLKTLDERDDLTKHRVEYVKRTRVPEKDIKKFIYDNIDHLDCVNIMVHDMDKREELLKDLSGIDDIYITSSIPYLIEISYIDCGKEKGLEIIGNKLGIPKEQMIAFGNADNDSGMLKYAGTGIAVANASDSCIDAADVVIGTNATDSVAKEIFEIIKRKM
ncbi:Cof subfamily of IIB subfamily of haloacid dehalogenase superfamily/HAD-superfamily hydrolase, subfamily IIB [Eubacterium ruminantium]|nr:Cof subfamily of IIB subfamily of haloacid dehalogenase superfamily/HAD-superfamily hydrolase, subfamily IIB [Eubacterium ruminantium]